MREIEEFIQRRIQSELLEAVERLSAGLQSINFSKEEREILEKAVELITRRLDT